MPVRRDIRTTLPETVATTGVNSGDAVFTQVALPLGDRRDSDGRAQTLIDLVTEGVAELGHKQVAYDLDMSPSQLSHALAGRDRHHVPLPLLLYVARKSQLVGDRIAKFFAAMRGFDVSPRRELTAEERLEKLETALRKNLGPELQRVVIADAFGEDE